MTSPKVYEGLRNPEDKSAAGETMVLVNGDPLPLGPSLKLFNHSPSGFNWGYGGSGPAQLALAILFDYYGDPEWAMKYHQHFKADVISKFEQGSGWKLTGGEIETWASDRHFPAPVGAVKRGDQVVALAELIVEAFKSSSSPERVERFKQEIVDDCKTSAYQVPPEVAAMIYLGQLGADLVRSVVLQNVKAEGA